MSHIDNFERYEELEAGRIIGDLDAAEVEEWNQLVKVHGNKDDLSLELTLSALETEFLESKEAIVPEHILAALHKGKVATQYFFCKSLIDR